MAKSEISQLTELSKKHSWAKKELKTVKSITKKFATGEFQKARELWNGKDG